MDCPGHHGWPAALEAIFFLPRSLLSNQINLPKMAPKPGPGVVLRLGLEVGPNGAGFFLGCLVVFLGHNMVFKAGSHDYGMGRAPRNKDLRIVGSCAHSEC